MSFSVQHVPSALEYCGSSLNLIFAQRKNIFNPKFIKFILEIDRFNKECTKILDNPIYEKYSMQDYVKEKGYSDDFLYKYLAPMSSALWSTPTDITIKFPAVALVRFFKNHGLLGLSTQYQWKTVRNGSWAYRDKLIAPFKELIKTNTCVQKVVRIGDKVKVIDDRGGETEFDKVIFACHADQALALLENPTELEKSLLRNFEYQKNIATLHTDDSLMPKLKKTWSAWNYRIETVNNELVAHTIYYMNKLQEISKKNDYFLSINQPNTVDPAKIVKTIEYEHPIFTPQAYKAQGELHKLNENGKVYFCGSYFKYGFHEDAFTSAVQLCTALTGKDAWEI
jgi:predicted NAD/FAD-binding protein